MKFIDKFIKKSTKTASVVMKDEVRKTAANVAPHLFGIASIIAGALIFKGDRSLNPVRGSAAKVIRSTRVVNNNYFFNDMSEEMVEKILENNRRRR